VELMMVGGCCTRFEPLTKWLPLLMDETILELRDNIKAQSVDFLSFLSLINHQTIDSHLRKFRLKR